MKAVTDYVAVTLLVAITVAIATLFVGWSITLTQTQTQTVGNKTKAAVDCTNAKITIDDVYIDLAANKTRISVRNSGLLGESVVSAIAISANGNVSSNLTAFPIALSKGDSVSIELNTSDRITACGNFSKAIVTTQCASVEFDGTPANC
jgi:hypothetical protein